MINKIKSLFFKSEPTQPLDITTYNALLRRVYTPELMDSFMEGLDPNFILYPNQYKSFTETVVYSSYINSLITDEVRKIKVRRCYIIGDEPFLNSNKLDIKFCEIGAMNE